MHISVHINNFCFIYRSVIIEIFCEILLFASQVTDVGLMTGKMFYTKGGLKIL